MGDLDDLTLLQRLMIIAKVKRERSRARVSHLRRLGFVSYGKVED